TRPVLGSIRETLPPWSLATQTAPEPIATATGSPPPRALRPIRFLDGLISMTVLLALSATQTPPSPTATSDGNEPEPVEITRLWPRRSKRSTPSATGEASQKAPAPTARP